MSIFPNIEIESSVQVDDKTRINCSKSFADKSEADISLVEIDPDGSTGYIDVTGSSSSDWYLDWEYSTDSGSPYTITCRVTTDGSPVTKTATITVVTAANDNLFAADSDLTVHEPDILQWVKDGRSSFLNIHRRVKDLRVVWFAEKGYTDIDGDPLTISAFVESDDLKQWAVFMALRIIMESQSNAIDDIFATRANLYASKERNARSRFIRLDLDGDTIADANEGARISSGSVFVR